MKNWLLAVRIKTLFAAVSPVLLASALAYHDGFYNLLLTIIILITAIFIQIGANFANDYYDFINGADTEDRLGPIRATQAGLILPEKMKNAMWTSFLLSVILGFYLAYIGGWVIVLIGICSIIAAIAYTGGPYPLGYNGFGDIFVFLFFGLIAVLGTYFLHVGYITNISIVFGCIMGMLSTSILVVNNLRDIDTDKISGKNTLAVLKGEKFSKLEYSFLLLTPFLCILFMWLLVIKKLSLLLIVFSLPIAINLIINIYTSSKTELNIVLGRTARFLFIFTILLSLGLVL